jgi:hypothetical protein
VGDAGIGIKDSLAAGRPEVVSMTDEEAIAFALEEGITGIPGPYWPTFRPNIRPGFWPTFGPPSHACCTLHWSAYLTIWSSTLTMFTFVWIT